MQYFIFTKCSCTKMCTRYIIRILLIYFIKINFPYTRFSQVLYISSKLFFRLQFYCPVRKVGQLHFWRRVHIPATLGFQLYVLIYQWQCKNREKLARNSHARSVMNHWTNSNFLLKCCCANNTNIKTIKPMWQNGYSQFMQDILYKAH